MVKKIYHWTIRFLVRSMLKEGNTYTMAISIFICLKITEYPATSISVSDVHPCITIIWPHPSHLFFCGHPWCVTTIMCHISVSTVTRNKKSSDPSTQFLWLTVKQSCRQTHKMNCILFTDYQVALSRYNTDNTKLVGVYVYNTLEVLSSTRNPYIKIHIQ
jgi:hypothetical protein